MQDKSGTLLACPDFVQCPGPRFECWLNAKDFSLLNSGKKRTRREDTLASFHPVIGQKLAEFQRFFFPLLREFRRKKHQALTVVGQFLSNVSMTTIGQGLAEC